MGVEANISNIIHFSLPIAHYYPNIFDLRNKNRNFANMNLYN